MKNSNGEKGAMEADSQIPAERGHKYRCGDRHGDSSLQRVGINTDVKTDTQRKARDREGQASQRSRWCLLSCPHLITEDLDLADGTVYQALRAGPAVIGINLQVQGDTLHPLL